jgi:hypothetical protein
LDRAGGVLLALVIIMLGTGFRTGSGHELNARKPNIQIAKTFDAVHFSNSFLTSNFAPSQKNII